MLVRRCRLVHLLPSRALRRSGSWGTRAAVPACLMALALACTDSPVETPHDPLALKRGDSTVTVDSRLATDNARLALVALMGTHQLAPDSVTPADGQTAPATGKQWLFHQMGPGSLKDSALWALSDAESTLLVVVLYGHGTSVESPNDRLTQFSGQLRHLGYDVLQIAMPLGGVNHDSMFNNLGYKRALPYFARPALSLLEYVLQHKQYSSVQVIGHSGGGWTATILAALDPRIKRSISVSGSLPMYLRAGDSWGDLEQTVIADSVGIGYLDLYALASDGTGRRHLQVLLTKDPCCFGASQTEFNNHFLLTEGYVPSIARYAGRVRRSGNNRDFMVLVDTLTTEHTLGSCVQAAVLKELAGTYSSLVSTDSLSICDSS